MKNFWKVSIFKLKKFPLYVIIPFSLVVFFHQIDLFGIKGQTEKQSARMINIALSHMYPSHNSYVLPVIITERTLERLGSSYPLPENILSDMIYMLSQFGAKAIFIDMTFSGRRKTELSHLLQAIKYAASNRTHIFFPINGYKSENFDDIMKLINESPSIHAVDISLGNNRSGLNYPKKRNIAVLTPAFAICAAFYGENWCRSDVAKLEIANIWWRGSEEESLYDAAKDVLQHIIRNISGDLKSYDDNKPIVYIKMETFESIYLGEFSGTDREKLTSQIVVIGQNLHGLNDSVETSIDDSMPSLLYHAMAIDNLAALETEFSINKISRHIIEVIIAIIHYVSICIYRKYTRKYYECYIYNNEKFIKRLIVLPILNIVPTIVVFGMIFIMSILLFEFLQMRSVLDLLGIIGAVELGRMLTPASEDKVSKV
ncbi:CHASE2 domain-containing protein [Tistrella mobilis]|nr:CHASE2 domain-containing protein [Tistrella mobilis]